MARLWDNRVLPFAMVLALGVVTLSWNAVVGLSWEGPGMGLILLACSPLLVIAAYAWMRGAKAMGEAVVFGCMYLVVPLVGVRLSYLVTTLGYPLIDGRLDHFDRAMGFDWGAWSDFVTTHPVVHALTFAAYMSPIEQALISTAIFSYVCPGKRNFEMLFTLVLALLAVTAIYTFLPELGPASVIDRHNVMEANILALRAGSVGPFPYIGIVSFPSYHTVMAIVFTYSQRGLRSFWPFAGLNALMLLGTPTYGDHFFADMCAGAAVAACAIMIGRVVYREARGDMRFGFPMPQSGVVAAE